MSASDVAVPGVTWRDIEFAAQLEEVSPVVIALLCAFDNHQRVRTAQLYAFFEGLCDGLTDAEGKIGDLEKLHERSNTIARQLEALETSVRGIRTLLARSDFRLGGLR